MRIPALLLLAALPVTASVLAQDPPAAPAAPTAPAKESFKAVVTAENAVILSGSSKAYYPVGHMQAGSILDVVDATYPNYYEIAPPGCCAAFVAKSKVKSDDKGANGTVTEDGTECFAAGLEMTPDKSFRLQRKLAKGETVEILAVVGDFYRIEEPANTTVFVPADQVRRASEADLKDGPPEAKPDYKPADAKKPVVKATEPKKPVKPVDKVADKPADKAVEKPVETAPPEPADDGIDTPATDPALRAAEGRRNAAYAAAKNTAVPSATLNILLAEYKQVAQRPGLNALDGQLANGRVAQLTRDLKISENLEKVTAAEKAAKDAGKPGDAVPQVGYDAVGQLKVSEVYNGASLPKLYRLADATTDGTVAYVLPEAVDASLINKLVGIQGDIEVDPVLKLRVIRVRKAEALKADGKPAAK